MSLLLNKEEQGIVVFLFWKSLPYRVRLGIAFVLIAAGFAFQFVKDGTLIGMLLILMGNCLLLVHGYDNRVELGAYDPQAKWQQVDLAMLDKCRELDTKMKSWDRSMLDVTNPLGCVTFGLCAIALFVFFQFSMAIGMTYGPILVIDTALLVVPHLITGVRSILTQPVLLLKIEVVEQVIDATRSAMSRHAVEYFMLNKSAGAKVPDDVKFRVKLAQQKPDFLGLYGQVVVNMVQGKKYPYFYAVLVAKKGGGLAEAATRYKPKGTTLYEFKVEGDVEVFVVRQVTSKTSGYYTKPAVAAALMNEALIIAEEVGQG